MLTTAKVRDLKPHKTMYEVTCAAMPGFILRVLPTGKKVFVVRYRAGGKDVRERIGLWGPDLSVDEARRRAVLLARGGDIEEAPPEPVVAPRASKPARAVKPVESRRSQSTVRELAERFEAEYIGVYLKAGTAKNYRRLLANYILPTFGDREFEAVSRRDAQGLHAKLKTTPGDADYAICVLGSLYTRIIVEWELSEMRNPTHGVRRFGSRKIERFLSPEERRRLREAMDTGLRIPPGRRGPPCQYAVRHTDPRIYRAGRDRGRRAATASARRGPDLGLPRGAARTPGGEHRQRRALRDGQDAPLRPQAADDRRRAEYRAPAGNARDEKICGQARGSWRISEDDTGRARAARRWTWERGWRGQCAIVDLECSGRHGA